MVESEDVNDDDACRGNSDVPPTRRQCRALLLVKSSPLDVESKKESKSIVPFERLVRSHGRVGLFIACWLRAGCHDVVIIMVAAARPQKK